MLQQDSPDDFVVATGEAHSVRDFVEAAFGHVGLEWTDFVETDNRYLRPTEVNFLLGDASKANRKLGWRPQVSFDELVRMMVDADMELARQEATLLKAGHALPAHTSSGF
jgi:GDPmannose 4,6-dehydratase